MVWRQSCKYRDFDSVEKWKRQRKTEVEEKHDFNHIWQKMRETTDSKALKHI